VGELIGLKFGAARAAGRAGVEPSAEVLVDTHRKPRTDDVSSSSFEASATRWTPELAKLAFLLTGEKEAAEDLVADALFAAWTQWPSIVEKQSPKAYVRRILINKAASRVRGLVRDRARVRLVGAAMSEMAPNVDIPAGIDLRHALERLPRRQRECVVLRYGLDLSEAEVAEVLGISKGTVKSQTSKGSNRLRDLLGTEART
jgi:RNA polymerase sigma-70 factor (sigma-E family)